MESRYKKIRQWQSAFLIAALIFAGIPETAMAGVWDRNPAVITGSAGGEDGFEDMYFSEVREFCVHHAEHTEECGYRKAHDCGHVHDQECYEMPDEDGGAVVRSDLIRNKATSSDATPSDAAHSDGSAENCVHIHDAGCGYVEARSCEYYCELCAGELSLEEQAKFLEEQMEARAAAPGTESLANIETASPANSRTGARMGAGVFRRAAGGRTSAPGPLSPFVIGSEAVLRELTQKVNSGAAWANGDISYAECSYVLREDVALTTDWTPIGTEEHPFAGTFDGAGFVVRGVAVDDPGIRDCGLFGYIKGGVVEDLGVADVDIRSGQSAGAVAGVLYEGTIRRCYSTGNVDISSYYSAEVGSTAGGIVGNTYEESVVKDCYNTGNVKAALGGGIAGWLSDSVMENCYNTGTVFSSDAGNDGIGGGLAGFFVVNANQRVAITNCIALNPSVDSDSFFNLLRRVAGPLFVESNPEGSHTLRNNYAFSGMKITGSVVPNGAHDNNDGGDVWYDAATGTFSRPWEEIFSDTSAWDIEDGKLPTLKGIGGQDGEIPQWILEGAAADLYIGTEAELKAFRDRVNGVGTAPEDFNGKSVNLTADIYLTQAWEPIGILGENSSLDRPFRGSFNGAGHVVNGVRVISNVKCTGLFGYVEGGMIENLGVKDANVENGERSGAVVGEINGGTISRCYSTGSVQGNRAGGIAGAGVNSASVKDCYSLARVSGTAAGGIGGYLNDANLERCYSAGAVMNGTDSLDSYGGGLAGILEQRNVRLLLKNSAALNPSIDSSFQEENRVCGEWTGLPDLMEIGDNYAFHKMEVGRPVTDGGQDNENGADLSYSPDTGKFSVSWETIFGDTSAWDIAPGKLPTLKGLGGQDGAMPQWISEREEAPLLIGSEEELKAFRDAVNGLNGMTPHDFAGQTVQMTADIRLTGDWTPIGDYRGNPTYPSFKGVFDGGGHIISGLTIRGSGSLTAGLFSYVNGGTIKNLGLKDVDIKVRNEAGAVAGYINNGMIENCFSEGTVTAEAIAGGIAGEADQSEIRNCYSRGSVTAEGAIGSIAGGIVGMAKTKGNRMEHCYSAGSVASVSAIGSRYAGGLTGFKITRTAGAGSVPETVRQNAALLHSLEGGTDITGRLVSGIDAGSEPAPVWEQNYAFSDMKVNGAVAEGDDGTGRNGRDGRMESLVMDSALFPASDWILTEGCYPELKAFADRGKTPEPLEYWLPDQSKGRFQIELEKPAAFTFPAAAEGYGACGAKAIAVANTGKDATGELKVTLEQQKDGLAKPAGAADYFILADTVPDGAAPGAAGQITISSIAPGETAAFEIAPAKGLKAGIYTARILIAGNYGLSAAYKVSFTVRQDGGSDEPARKPEYTILTGEVPSSVGTGDWERQPGGGWKFKKQGKAVPGSGIVGAGILAVKEWLMIDGFWYLFDENGQMVTGWARVNGLWYCLSTAAYAAANPEQRTAGGTARRKEGAMITGWFCDADTGLWYWLDENGVMAAGWRQIDGKRYYFNPESDGTQGALKGRAE